MKVTNTKINSEKSEGFAVGYLERWRSSAEALPLESRVNPYPWVGFGPKFPLGRNWLEVQAKVEAQVCTWFRRHLSLKGRAEVCAAYFYPLILHRFSGLFLLPKQLSAVNRTLKSLLRKGSKSMVRRQVCYQWPCNGGLGMPDFVSHWLAERLTFLSLSLTRDAA